MNSQVFSLALATLISLSWAPAAKATVITTTNNTPVTICDRCTIQSTIDVNDHLTISDVDVYLADLKHTYDRDLKIQLTSPVGTTVLLSNRRGGSGDNYINTVFDDEASAAVSAAAAPFSGRFRPESPLSAFDGQDMFGLWTLRIEDLQGLDAGRLNRWGVSFTGIARNEVPEPASLALIGLAVAGAVATRRGYKV